MRLSYLPRSTQLVEQKFYLLLKHRLWSTMLWHLSWFSDDSSMYLLHRNKPTVSLHLAVTVICKFITCGLMALTDFPNSSSSGLKHCVSLDHDFASRKILQTIWYSLPFPFVFPRKRQWKDILETALKHPDNNLWTHLRQFSGAANSEN